ncbi:hypothetical protein [Archangium sp.]|uniref:hypothetical protein n=1 Tax=Archangium sp. TaxID=1872627 RepID=UPI002D2AD8DD|nr:hypothetical protein [Archangium sp.]HYO54822.1 hypothetical protein [Archangium sp.]
MKSFSSLFCCLLLAVSAAGCWVSELPEYVIFSCDTDDDCDADGVVCIPRTGQRGFCCKPVAEMCNDIDDDCNGQTDEGFNLQTDNAHCGVCGNACNAVTETCVNGTCKSRGELVCDNELDDDTDGAKDCADPDCVGKTCNKAGGGKGTCAGSTCK